MSHWLTNPAAVRSVFPFEIDFSIHPEKRVRAAHFDSIHPELRVAEHPTLYGEGLSKRIAEIATLDRDIKESELATWIKERKSRPGRIEDMVGLLTHWRPGCFWRFPCIWVPDAFFVLNDSCRYMLHFGEARLTNYHLDAGRYVACLLSQPESVFKEGTHVLAVLGE
jgi:hypothetical protein